MKTILFFFFGISIYYTAASQSNSHLESAMCGPIPAVCNPTSIHTGGLLGVGIIYFSLGQISNTSTSSSVVGYQDFTCSDSTFLNQGDSYQIELRTGQTYVESINTWIDFNNDGYFDPAEVIYFDPGSVYTHAANITIPVMGLLGTPLRMRVGSESEPFPPPDGCNNVQYGQYEDYTVYLNGPTGIGNNEKENSITFFPNPFHSEGRLEIGEWGLRNRDLAESYAVLKIYNSMGSLLREDKILNLNSYILHRDGLHDGLYFYELQSLNYELLATGKFIVE